MFLQSALTFLLVAQAVPQLNEPVRLTTSPAEDYMPAIWPGGGLMAFVSNRVGAPNIWIKSIRGANLPTPYRLTFHTSGDKSPAFSADGKKLAFVSYASDAQGDLYLIKLPKATKFSGFRPDPVRLTDITTADRQPVFAPDGKSIVYTSADKKSGAENLWDLELGSMKKKRLTRDGGHSPAIAPDGASIVFVSSRGGAKSALYRRNMTTGAVTPLTDGKFIDSFPAFANNHVIVFTRYAEDANNDGQATIEDNPALYTLDINNPDKPPVQLTTTESYNLFPTVSGGNIYYTAKKGARVDIFRLPIAGVAPPLGTLKQDIARAGAIKRYYPARPRLALMAWQVAWSANNTDPDRGALALCLARRGAILKTIGSPGMADAQFADLVKKYPEQRRLVGDALIERAILRSQRLGLAPDKLIERLREIAGEYGDISAVRARARMEVGSAYLKARRPAKALELFRSVIKEFNDIGDISAQAAFRRNEVYEMMGDSGKLMETYLDVIRSYPTQGKWRNLSAQKMVDMAVVKDDIKTSLRNLGAMTDNESYPPFLRAVAMMRMARLYQDNNELVLAMEVYRQTADRFADLKDTRNTALFRVAAIHADREEYEKALAIYDSIEKDTDIKREVFVKVVKARIRQALAKAKYALKQGDRRVAIKTYRELLERDYSIIEAHRGLIRARAMLGEAEETAQEYESLLKQDPRSPVNLYSLGLAATYLKPPALARAQTLVGKALAIDSANHWYHQTLGWVYEQEDRAEPEEGYAERALNEYQYALALVNDEDVTGVKADLYLNLGNVNFMLANYADARTWYKARHDSGAVFATARAESVFYQRWGECEYKLGDDTSAIRHFTTALKLAGDDEGERRVAILERTGLAYQSAGKWEKAAGSFTKSLVLRRELGLERGRVVALRNVANNLFFMGKSGAGVDRERLRSALGYYKQAERIIIKEKKRKPGKGISSPFSFEIETGAGGVHSASKGFGLEEEKKLIFHHIGRIYGELEDYGKAVEYFEKKLALTPSALPLTGNVPALTEKAIIMNQTGYYLARLGKVKAAVGRFGESLALSVKLGNNAGIVINADNMALLALGNGAGLTPELLDDMADRIHEAVGKLIKSGDYQDKQALAALANHLGQLYHARLFREPVTDPDDIAQTVVALRSAGRSAAMAQQLYETAGELYTDTGATDSARAAITASVNLAILKNDLGLKKPAIELLDKASAKAADSGATGLGWRIDYLLNVIDPVGHSKNLDSSATALEQTQFRDEYGKWNPRLTSAMILSIYGRLADRAYGRGDRTVALSALETGLNTTIRLGLAGMASNPAVKKYSSLITTPGKLDLESVMNNLDDDESAVTIWRADSADILFIVTADGLETVEMKPGASLLSALKRTGRIKSAHKVYLVTGRPFTDPDAVAPSGGLMISAIPSFGYLPIMKQKVNMDDFRLMAFGFDKPPIRAGADLLESVFVRDKAAMSAVKHGALQSPGVLAFALAPWLRSHDPVRARFPLNSGGADRMWIPIGKLLERNAGGAALVTPPVDSAPGREWEGALQTLSLMAGFPAWIVTPTDEAQRGVFFSALTGNLGGSNSTGSAFVSAVKSAPGAHARLLGSFGIGGAKRAEYARNHFTERIRAGVSALGGKDYKTASNFLKQALVYTRTAGLAKYEAPLLNRLADVEFRLGRYESALKYQNKLNTIYSDKGEDEKLADSLSLTGVMWSRLGEYGKSVESLQKALDIYRRIGATDKMADAWARLGVAEEGHTRYAAALTAYESALGVESYEGKIAGMADNMRRIGRIYHLRLNDFAKARQAYTSALKTLEQAGATHGKIAHLLIDLGAVETDAGALEKAENLFVKALKQAESAGNNQIGATARFHLANVHWFRGEYGAALDMARLALKQFESAGDARHMAMTMNTVGLVYWTLNDYPRSLDYLGRALASAGKAGARLDTASVLNNTGLIYRQQGKLDESIEYFKRARVIDDELKSDWGVAYDSRNISISLLMKGDVEKAQTLALTAVELTEKIGDRINHAKALLNLAQIISAKKSWGRAMTIFRSAQIEAAGVGAPEVEWRAMYGQGRALTALGESDKAIAVYKRAVNVVEKMRANVKIEELKSGFLEDKQSLYEDLILLLMDRGAVTTAFVYAERARARSFIDMLGTSKITLADKVSQKQYDDIMALKRKLEELSKISTGQGKDESAQTERIKTSGALRKAIARLRVDNPGLLPFVTVQPVDPARLESLLTPGVMLVEYVMTEKELIAFVVGADGIKSARVPVRREKLTGMVLRFRKRIQDIAPLETESRELYDILLAPIMDKLAGARVVGIIPNRALHYLSFASLKSDDGYLIDTKSLFYVSSASVFAEAVKRRSATPKQRMRALALGNPDLGDFNTDLPLAELEAKSLKWDFPSTDTLTRGSATETAIKKNAGKYQVLHIASHGQYDPANPLLSALMLSADKDNDGALTAKEVFSVSLNADMVVLSACQTGLGKVTGGDEVTGLDRAFLFSGAHTIVSTLWRVDDLTSAVLIKHFYRQFARTGKAEALRKAQLAVKRRFAHPSYWAGFTLVGDYL